MTRIAVIVSLLMFWACQAFAQQSLVSDDELELSVSENIAVPQLPQKYKGSVVAHVDQLRRMMRQSGLNANVIRDGEVLKVVIPCADLFAPNEVDLLPKGEKILNHFRQVVIFPDRYKIVVAVHTDDTGEEAYADHITEQRATAIDDYFYHMNGDSETYVIPYGIGRDEPLKPNNSILNRATNRRVDIYVVPTLNLLDKIK